jgi:hypothetical protein
LAKLRFVTPIDFQTRTSSRHSDSVPVPAETRVSMPIGLPLHPA